MAGPLKTLYGALQQSPFLQSNNVTLIYGAEDINTQKNALPLIVMAPKGGPFKSPGYAQGIDPYTELLWETAELVDFWCWNASNDPNAQAAIDHADAIETLRQLLLSALQDQRAQYTDSSNIAYGLQYRVMDGRWEVMGNAPSRYGRAYVLSVVFDVSIAMAAPALEATVTSVPPPTPVVIHTPP